MWLGRESLLFLVDVGPMMGTILDAIHVQMRLYSVLR